MIPLLHDFTGTTVLVFGGGPVGARKARRFAAEARVVVVSPDFCAAAFEPAERRDPDAGVEFVRAAPTAEDLPGWFDRVSPALAVAATDDAAVNAAVERLARERGVLVNRADRAGERAPGSVVVPATVRDGDVVVSLSTGVPALSAYLRERVGADIAGVGELARVVADLRADLKARGIDPTSRREAVRRAVRSERVWKVLGTGESNVRRTATDVASDALGDNS
jgi:precorrin-2 dehydrogenase/sirohydrochlorin ferrochelatase